MATHSARRTRTAPHKAPFLSPFVRNCNTQCVGIQACTEVFKMWRCACSCNRCRGSGRGAGGVPLPEAGAEAGLAVDPPSPRPTSGSAITPNCLRSRSPIARVVASTPITRSPSFQSIWPPALRMRSCGPKGANPRGEHRRKYDMHKCDFVLMYVGLVLGVSSTRRTPPVGAHRAVTYPFVLPRWAVVAC